MARPHIYMPLEVSKRETNQTKLMKTPPPRIRPSIQFLAAITGGIAAFYVLKFLSQFMNLSQ